MVANERVGGMEVGQAVGIVDQPNRWMCRVRSQTGLPLGRSVSSLELMQLDDDIEAIVAQQQRHHGIERQRAQRVGTPRRRKHYSTTALVEAQSMGDVVSVQRAVDQSIELRKPY